uniref:Uncharacterized protein n=1 Tax=Siphoviridae sp. ctsoB6 TaxID=2826487 RepID=A0A8S5QQ32_9CAUD|nr:MAG TPA: hypothetical protein [Siphoviridae sp. ctsoB6]
MHSPNHFIPLVWFCLTLTAATVGVVFFYWLHLVTVCVTDKNSLKSILLQMLH